MMKTDNITILSIAFLLLLSCGVCLTTTSQTRNLYFSLMVSSAPGQNTTGVVPAVERALEDINNDPTLLPGYTLSYTRVVDTQCNSTRALQLFQEEMESNTTVLAAVGCGCSSATEQVARNTTVPVISYASTSLVLSDRSVYTNYFRTVPSDELVGNALIKSLTFWERNLVSFVNSKEKQFDKFFESIEETANETTKGFSIYTSKNTTTNTFYERDSNGTHVTPKDIDSVFIQFLNIGPNAAIEQLCEAYKSGRYYPKYLWITAGWYSDNWWEEFPDYLTTLNCTLTQVEQVLNRSLTFVPKTSNQDSRQNFSEYAAVAVKALSLAINESLNAINCNESCIQDMLTENIQELTNPSFNNEGGQLVDRVQVLQYRNTSGSLKRIPIGFVQNERNFSYIHGQNKHTTWPEGVPFSGNNSTRTDEFPIPLLVIEGILFTIGSVFTIACLLFNIIFRNKRIVKLTSPNLNYIMIVGVAVELSSLILRLLFVHSQQGFLVICSIRRLFISVGHDIIFSFAVVKAWRINYIFNNPKPSKKALKDWKLILTAVLVVSIDLVINIIFLGLDTKEGLKYEERFEHRQVVDDNGIVQIRLFATCPSSVYFYVFCALTAIFKIGLHIPAVILAIMTRKIKIDIVNDYKYTTTIISVSTILILILVGLIVASRYLITFNIIVSILVFTEAMVFLTISFIPKMIALYKDPNGEFLFVHKTDRSRSESTASTIKVGKIYTAGGTLEKGSTVTMNSINII